MATLFDAVSSMNAATSWVACRQRV
jgi:hypothetical protein